LKVQDEEEVGQHLKLTSRRGHGYEALVVSFLASDGVENVHVNPGNWIH